MLEVVLAVMGAAVFWTWKTQRYCFAKPSDVVSDEALYVKVTADGTLM